MIEGISKATWEHSSPSQNPFLRYEFFKALLKSGSIGGETGWELKLARVKEEAFMPYFEKTHSFGEYIFDWSWAEAYERYGVPYYPKITSMIPFTPVTHSHFFMKTWDEVLGAKLLHETEEASRTHSGLHFLFITPQETAFFKDHQYLIRESLQYHFFNDGFASMEEYFGRMKSRKRKTLQKERLFQGLNFTSFTGEELTVSHARRMYQFYIQTIVDKNSYNYLTEAFFLEVFQTMPENILYVEASRAGMAVAASLFFFDEECLYGRYWGSFEFIENLHFELCYYQGIEFCIRKGLQRFEAGAQGEHKIARGFAPVKTYSAHKIKHQAFRVAIGDFINQEARRLEELRRELGQGLPWRE